jgi:biopolymer transport protein ExbB
MKNENSFGKDVKSGFAVVVIPVTLVLSYLLYLFVLGNESNFKGGNPEADPINVLGIIYKGGIIVPVLLAFFILVITFSIERFFTLNAAYGKGKLNRFVRAIKEDIKKGNVSEALRKSEEQKGSVGNVVTSVLSRYTDIAKDHELARDQKKVAVQQEVDEALALELPILEKNLTIIATLASTATLIGLLGTVIGMIKAFAALATSGAPDASALANGISEALINTALGIGSSAFAIWSYNYFNSQIDTLISFIDEIGFTVTQQVTITAGRANGLSKHSADASLKENVNLL